MHIQAVALYRPWYRGSINRGIVKVHMSHFLTAYPTDPVPELSNALTHYPAYCLENLIFPLVKKFPVLYWKPNSHCRAYSSLDLLCYPEGY
jgi:hypothetical protein